MQDGSCAVPGAFTGNPELGAFAGSPAHFPLPTPAHRYFVHRLQQDVAFDP